MTKICTNCSEKAKYQDDIYSPVSYYSCGDYECELSVAMMLWETSRVEVME